MARQKALLALRSKGLGWLKGGLSSVNGPFVTGERLFTLEVEPHGKLAASALRPEPPCGLCGRVQITRPSQVIIDSATIPAHLGLFRLVDLTTAVFAKEEVIDLIESLGLTGCRADEVLVE